MVATFSNSNNQMPLFSYLKPCQPAPGIAHSSVSQTDPFNAPLSPMNKRQRILSLLLGTAHVAAVALGLWGATANTLVPVKSSPIAVQQPSDGLWAALGSDALSQTLLEVKAEQTQAALAEAERDRLQAQQLRLDAEAQAQNLTAQAANQARQTTVAAVRSAEAIALDASYVGAEQVIYAETDTDISLKFAARIQCKDGRFGETAVASPTDSHITPREVRNLAVCYPNPETAAGKPIGQAGEWGVAFFKLE